MGFKPRCVLPLLLLLLLACWGAAKNTDEFAPAAELSASESSELASDAAKKEGEEVQGKEEAEKEGEEAGTLHKVTVTVSVMLFGMLLVGVGLINLVNHSDIYIRRYSFKMISVTLSVFIAVMFNQAFFAFWVEQIIEGQHPKIFGINNYRINCAFACVVFGIFWIVMTYLCYSARLVSTEHFPVHQRLYAVGHLGAHSCAFAGIFAAIQAVQSGVNEEQGSILLTCMTIGAAIIMLRILWVAVRRMIISGMGDDKLGGDRFHETFKEEIKEGHVEAVVLTLSFLFNQLFCQILLDGKLPPLHGRMTGIEWSDVRTSFTGAGCCVFALSIYIFILRTSRADFNSLHSIIIHSVAMSMSWCLKNASSWAMQLFFAPVKSVTPELTDVINAFVVTVLSVLLVIVLDFFADLLNAGSETQGMSTKKMLLGRIPGGKSQDFTALILEDPKERAEENSEESQANAAEELGTVLRIVTLAFGLLVALSWDRAFDVAMETVIEGCADFGEGAGIGKHVVISKVVVSALLVVFVFPAWYHHIVPKALEADEAWEEEHVPHHHDHSDVPAENK